MISRSFDELEKADTVGEYEECLICGALVKVDVTDDKILSFIKCCGKTYLVGIKGKSIRRGGNE